MPEYLKNKIEKIKDQAEVWVFEKRHEKSYNTIRKRIESLIGSERIITWGDNPEDILLRSIHEIQPDVIHFEEPCEQFLSDHMLDQIFRENRRYRIFETMHDSSVSPLEKVYLPDKFIVVSPWQVKLLQSLNVPIEVIEHELPQRNFRDYEGSRNQLGLDPNKKHIIQIGIFTPRKNQRETAELANLLPEYQFHFIGTLAENFKWYWEPILSKLPSNCKIWGERNDVDLFYQAADLVIFPSIALFNDKETSPLVIKESIAWKSPLLLRNLPVYVDMYQESDTLKFFRGNDLGSVSDQIREILGAQKLNNTKTSNMFVHRFYPEENKIDLLYIGDNRNIPLVPCDVYIKDIDTGANIYHFFCEFGLGNSYWTIPIPKHIYDFQNNPTFGGFKIEFRNGEEMIAENLIRLKDVRNKKVCRLDTKDPIFRNFEEFFTDRIYDPLLNSIFGRKVAVDVGANVGLFTEYCLDVGFERVLSFEPNREAVGEFRKMHSENPAVELRDIAVTGDGEPVELSVNPGNSLISSISKNVGENTISVQSQSLNSILSEFEEIDLLKIDIEGAEYSLFEKTEDGLLNRAKNIILEFHDNIDGRVDQLTDKLTSAGFRYKMHDELIRYEVDRNSDHGVIFAKR